MKLLEEMKEFFEEAKSKPDYLDMDGDGNKKEPMKKAIKDKEANEAAKPDYLDADGDGDEEESMKKAFKDKKLKEGPDTTAIDKQIQKDPKFLKKVQDAAAAAEKGDSSALALLMMGGLDEANVTGNLDGGEGPQKTPYAFGKSEDENDNAEVFDYKKSKTTDKHFESTYKRMISTMEELQEISYRDYKKDPTSTPQQKVNRGIMEVNRMLAEMEKIVNNNLRLKTEMGVQSGHFWKATGKRFAKINERMLRVAHRLKELSQ